jgi:D-proline reductase (dithiol) PrdB
MVRMADVYEGMRPYLEELGCITFSSTPWVADARPLSERRIAIVSTAGLQRRGDRPFAADAADYRVLPADSTAANVVMSHVSLEYDRTGFQQDLNVIFPIDRLRELAAEGVIGSVADFHYSVMGATSPDEMEPAAHRLSALFKADAVDTVLLVPV